MGLSCPLDGFTVSLAPDAAPALLKVDADATDYLTLFWLISIFINFAGLFAF
jgi:hypothetical protein